MREDKAAPAEKVIQRRLARLGANRIHRPKCGLRALLIVFTIAPCAIWLAYVVTKEYSKLPTIPLTPEERAYRREQLLIVDSFVPIVLAAVISGLAAWCAVYCLGRRYAEYGAGPLAAVGAAMVIVAAVCWAIGKGMSTIALADGGDVAALYGLPIGIAVFFGALVGWKSAELD